MEKTLALEAYLGILVLAPLFGAKKSPFVRFHVNQGPSQRRCRICDSAFSQYYSECFSPSNRYSSASYGIVGFAGLPPRKLEKLLPCFLLQWIHQNGRQPLFLFPTRS